MSFSFHVFTDRARIPDARAWAQAIAVRGFATRLGAGPEPGFDPASFSGYVPCPDDRSGFDLFVEPYSAANFEIGPDGMAVIGARDTVLTFRFSGRETDRDAAMEAAATLTLLTDGILFDVEARHFVAASTALEWARGEKYSPVAVYRIRASRRRARIRISTILRLLILLALAVSVLTFTR
jgi:hypothetical protein